MALSTPASEAMSRTLRSTSGSSAGLMSEQEEDANSETDTFEIPPTPDSKSTGAAFRTRA